MAWGFRPHLTVAECVVFTDTFVWVSSWRRKPFSAVMSLNILVSVIRTALHLIVSFVSIGWCAYFDDSSVSRWKKSDWCLRPWFCTVRLYWAWDNLGEWDEFCYESYLWYRIDYSTFWPVVQRTTTVPRMPPLVWWKILLNVVVCVMICKE